MLCLLVKDLVVHEKNETYWDWCILFEYSLGRGYSHLWEFVHEVTWVHQRDIFLASLEFMVYALQLEGKCQDIIYNKSCLRKMSYSSIWKETLSISVSRLLSLKLLILISHVRRFLSPKAWLLASWINNLHGEFVMFDEWR